MILATLYFVKYSETQKQQKNHLKADRSIKIKKTLEKANAFFNSGKYDSAYFYFNKTQLLCEPKEDYPDEYVGSLNSIVEILQRYGNYYEAETTLIKGFPYLDKTTNIKHAVNAYTFMAFNYYYTNDNEKAIFYHKKALKKAVSTFRKSRIISEIAFMYMQQGKFQEAVDLLEPIARLKIEDKITPSNTDILRSGKLYNLGLCYFYLGNHKKEALDCFNESLEIGLTLNNDYELIGNYYALYQYYKKYNNPALKKINAEKAYICAKKAKSVANEITMLGALIEADNAENSKNHSKIYLRMVDSLTVSRKKAKNQFADIIYNSQKDKDENLELKNLKAENELKLQRQKNRSTISYVVISFALIVSLFIIYFVTSKGKKEKDEAIFKNEMRISEKLQFELEKDIDKIVLFTENYDLEKEKNKEKFLSHLNNIYLKTRNISRENSEIVTDENFEKALKEMISGYTNQNLNIIINGLHSFSWSKIDRVKKITVFRVLQEIFDQMKTLNNPSLASITFKKEKKNILITYTDNGNEISSKHGILEKRLQNVENRIKTIKGTLNFDTQSENGFKISFKFSI
ncbi:MAG: tetratricopeptide repeat protein [Flavobacterium sp.]|uniref:ATP-binding protein n=1 Tax=Flavobacterium sp. TaxID=239 RepID=UPI001B18FA40|nr:tetratricopeptide repeat protein [Flavobacterium sp.]MBO9587027.1 tetratricopeptide repeat protein [Flavobacterium sp.]